MVEAVVYLPMIKDFPMNTVTFGLYFIFGMMLFSIVRGQDLPVTYVHPDIGRVSFVVPQKLRGDYERCQPAPEQDEVHDSFTIYFCSLPRRGQIGSRGQIAGPNRVRLCGLGCMGVSSCEPYRVGGAHALT